MDRVSDLCDLARDVSESLESLIRFGASGELTIYVIADDWPVRSSDETEDTATGPVFLLAEDLHRSMNAQCTRVRQVRRPTDDEVLTLDKPVDVDRGIHFVTAEEAERFSRKHALTLRSSTETPSYLNPNHDFYSTELAIAVRAWVALFASGDFDPKGKSAKSRILQWLSKNAVDLTPTARANIATLVNPNKDKVGGNPTTPVKST